MSPSLPPPLRVKPPTPGFLQGDRERSGVGWLRASWQRAARQAPGAISEGEMSVSKMVSSQTGSWDRKQPCFSETLQEKEVVSNHGAFQTQKKAIALVFVTLKDAAREERRYRPLPYKEIA